jgi:FkbM family methyltransferase
MDKVQLMTDQSGPANRYEKSVFPTYISDAGLTLQCRVAYNQYGGYCMPLSSIHRPAARSILSGAVWEPETIKFIAEHCKNGDIIHAGTYFGDFLPALSKSCANGSKIWAFEPNPENFRCAVITALINGLPAVELINAGLGDKECSLPMMIADDTGRSLGGSSRLTLEAGQEDKSRFVEVAIVTIDEVVSEDRQVTILQLDLEGFEMRALAGAMETIKRCKPVLILETLPTRAWLTQNILKLGYQVAGKLHDNTVLAVNNERITLH